MRLLIGNQIVRVIPLDRYPNKNDLPETTIQAYNCVRATCGEILLYVGRMLDGSLLEVVIRVTANKNTMN